VKTTIPVVLRRGATLVAAGRVALGVTALVWPAVPARPWVGKSSSDVAATVFGRALGARDLALGLGALAALRAEDGEARAWLAAGALSDALDVVASVASWPELPRLTRWLVAGSAGGAALTGAAAALSSSARASHSGKRVVVATTRTQPRGCGNDAVAASASLASGAG